MSTDAETFGNVVRHVIIDILLVTMVAGAAAFVKNVSKICNSSSKAFVSISCAADETGAVLKQINNEFKPISKDIRSILDRVDKGVDVNSGKIYEILDRVDNMLDPNDFKSDPRSIGGKVKVILDNLGELSSKLRAMGNNIKVDGSIDLDRLTGKDIDKLSDEFCKLAEGVDRFSRDGAFFLLPRFVTWHK